MAAAIILKNSDTDKKIEALPVVLSGVRSPRRYPSARQLRCFTALAAVLSLQFHESLDVDAACIVP